MQVSELKITEGYMPFLGYRTYYRLVGEPTGRPPLVLLHGGPGSTHNYFEMLDALALDDQGEPVRQVVMYDQLGCGKSWVEGHPELWHQETWEDELDALREYLHLDRIHLLGQSWGGMLEIAYMLDHRQGQEAGQWPWLRQPDHGVVSLVLSSTLPSSQLWGREQHRMIKEMPKEEQEAIQEAESTGNFASPAYLAANRHFMELHCGPSVFPAGSPKCLTMEKRVGTEAYNVAWGPNEYTPTGTLRDFDYTDQLQEIHTPALIISGTNDLCTPLIAKTMYDRIPGARWELFENCRHMCFIEANEKYIHLVRQWLAAQDR